MKNGDIYNLLSFFCKYVDIVYIFFICIWIVIFVRSAGVSNFCCFFNTSSSVVALLILLFGCFSPRKTEE